MSMRSLKIRIEEGYGAWVENYNELICPFCGKKAYFWRDIERDHEPKYIGSVDNHGIYCSRMRAILFCPSCKYNNLPVLWEYYGPCPD